MTIDAIRDDIHHHMGNEVVITHNEGRNKRQREIENAGV